MSKYGPKPKASGGVELLDRIFASVVPDPETGCWNSTIAIGSGRYPQLRLQGRGKVSVHRIVVMLRGYVLRRGDVVMHCCDNVRCCRPDHLMVGMQAHNVADMVAKGRQRARSRR